MRTGDKGRQPTGEAMPTGECQKGHGCCSEVPRVQQHGAVAGLDCGKTELRWDQWPPRIGEKMMEKHLVGNTRARHHRLGGFEIFELSNKCITHIR